MASLQARLLIALALIGGGLVATKTAIELSRVESPVATAAGLELKSALLESAPALARAFRAGDARALEQTLRAAATSSGSGDVALVNARRLVVSASRVGLDRHAAEGTPLAPALRLARDAAGGVKFEGRGATLLAALPITLETAPPDVALPGPPPLPETGFVLARADLGPAFAAARLEVLRANAALALVLVALLLVAGAIVQLSLAAPARRIAKAIDRFDLGERAARTGIERGDLARIARAFDAMAERMQLHETDLLETKRRLETALRCVPVGVMVVRRDDGRPIYVNARWKELFGIPMDATRDILSLLSTVRCERPDGSPYPLERLPIPTALRTGRPVETEDLRVRRDDALIALSASAVPVSLWRDDTFDAVVAVVARAGASMVPSAAFVPPSAPAPAEPAVESLTPAMIRPLEEPAPEPEITEADLEPLTPDPPLVLVVEGEAALRATAESTLTLAGFRVLVTGSGAEAITFFRGEAAGLAAVVLDLWVPGPGGGALLDEMLAIDPAARIVAASGYRPDMPELAASGKVVAFLPKPYGPQRLLATLRDVTEGGLAGALAGSEVPA